MKSEGKRMIIKEARKEFRHRRHERIRKRLRGTSEKPRLAIFRSLKHIYAQIIDDESGKTLVASSSMEKSFREIKEKGPMKEVAKKIGTMLAEKAIQKGIKQIIFDRAGYKYHGRVAALAESAREAGLEF
jgi:large subunit ribosomal protein L18